MRHLVLGSLGRRVSWTLVTAFLIPLLVLAMPPRQARAQLTRLPAVAVLDFGVLTSSRTSAILGRNATDAIVVEMNRTGRYEVTPRAQLNQQLADLGLTLPLNNNGIQKLGGALGVDYVASGDIVGITFSENPRRARVSLSVRLTDVVSGELANGSIQTGFSPVSAPGLQVDDEALISQAITDAAFNCLRQITNYTLPEATVLTTANQDSVTLNRGTRDGITTGQEMIVIRGRDRVGKIKVNIVGSTDSNAVITDIGKGIRPEDKARAIFKLPGYNVDPGGNISSGVPTVSDFKQNSRRPKPILATVLGIVAAVFLATLLFDKSSRNNGGGVSGVTARAYADGSVPTALAPTAARVQLTWRPGADVPINNIIEYHIFRDDSIIGVTTRTNTTFTDTPNLTDNFVTYQVISFNGNIPGNTPGTPGTNLGTNGTNGTTNNGGTNNGGTNNGGTNNGGTNTGSNTGTTPATPNTLTSVSAAVSPLSVGVTHRYRVSVLYVQVVAVPPTTGGGTNAGGSASGNSSGGNAGGGTGGGNTGGGTNTTSTTLYRESNLLASSGAATPLSRPQATGPVADQNLAAVRVSYRTTPGADQYIVEFARDPSFKNLVRKGPFFTAFTNGVDTQTETYDLSGNFNSVVAGQRIYYRIGARSSNDNPGPLPRDTPSGGDYIYSADNLSFAKIGNPPSPPQLTP